MSSIPFDPGALVREARHRAALSQRAMAERAGTAQSVVARIETGATDPSSGTLARLLAVANLELVCDLSPVAAVGSHMLQDVDRILGLTPEERLIEVRNFARFEAGTRRA